MSCSSRSSARFNPATAAPRSPQFISGLRQLLEIMATTSSLSVPSRYSLVDRMRSPSWKTSPLVPSMLPGTLPPMSLQWMNAQAKHRSSPSAKIGFRKYMSFKWVTMPAVV